MAGKRIEWTLTAKQSLKEITAYYYVRNKSYTYSRKIVSVVHKHIRLLKQQPFMGKSVPNSDKRVLLILHYHLFYKITDHIINILDIWAGRRYPESIKYYKEECNYECFSNTRIHWCRSAYYFGNSHRNFRPA